MAQEMKSFDIEHIDMLEIERRARAQQAEAFAAMFGALRMKIAAHLRREPTTQTA